MSDILLTGYRTRLAFITPGYTITFFLFLVSYICSRFFPPKYIRNVNTFQDAGFFKNNPLISALLKVAAIFLLIKKSDFVVFLGTGESTSSNINLFTEVSYGI